MSPSEFLTIIQSLPRSQSGFPTKDSISKATKLNPYTVKTMLGGLVNNGKLRMEGNWYKFNEIEITEKQTQDYIEAITEENKPTIDELSIPNIKMPKRFQTKIDSFTILRYSMLILGIISASLLVYYISIYAKENLTNTLAYIRSIVIVVFSFTSFQVIIVLSKQAKNIIGYIGIVLFCMFWLLVVIFSMLSTVAGQFQLFSGKQNVIIISSTEYNDTITRENELINNRNIILNQINPYLKQLSTELNEKQLSDVQYRITLYNRAVQKIDDEIKIIRERKAQLSNGKNIEQNNSFYTWLSGIIKWPSNNIQLFLYILPALFLDLIGPISFSIFLFLRRKDDV